MANKVLRDPDIADVIAHVAAVLGEAGIYVTASTDTEAVWYIPAGDSKQFKLHLFWSHAEQRVMLTYPKASRTGKFKHLSQLKCSKKVYLSRISEWLQRNLEMSGPPPVITAHQELTHEQKMAKNGWQTWRTLNSGGWYWWWDGDMEAAPVPVHLAYAITDCMHFATAGQLGWTRSQLVSTMGGWWCPMTPPAVFNP